VLTKRRSILHACVNELILSVMQEGHVLSGCFGEGFIQISKINRTLLLGFITVSGKHSRSLPGAYMDLAHGF